MTRSKSRGALLGMLAGILLIPSLTMAGPASVLISTDAGCTVSVDGTEVAFVAANGVKKVDVSGGQHLVTAVTVDGRRTTKTIEARDTQVVITFEFGAAQQVASAPAGAITPVAAAPAAAPVSAPANEPPPQRVPAGAKVYIAPMGGYETFLVAAMRKKEVPLTFMGTKETAEFEITGAATTQKASFGKMLFTGSSQSGEDASITVTHLKSGAIVYSYAYNKGSALRGKQSSSEACAKHLKNHIEGHE